jgi:hypothetical protein
VFGIIEFSFSSSLELMIREAGLNSGVMVLLNLRFRNTLALLSHSGSRVRAFVGMNAVYISLKSIGKKWEFDDDESPLLVITIFLSSGSPNNITNAFLFSVYLSR